MGDFPPLRGVVGSLIIFQARGKTCADFSQTELKFSLEKTVFGLPLGDGGWDRKEIFWVLVLSLLCLCMLLYIRYIICNLNNDELIIC